MLNGEEIALRLTQLDRKNNKEYKEIDAFFPYTNEDIRNYSEVFDFENKNVLTVCGSGDQVFNAIVLGSNNVTAFDINRVAFYHLELKRALIEHFNLKQFLNFYQNDMNENGYKKIREYLNKDCINFWDKLYNSNKPMTDYFGGYMMQTYSNYMEMLNPYLDRSKYELLQEKLKIFEIKTIQSDIFKLKEKLSEKFDIMNFSNILNNLTNNKRINYSYKSVIDSLNWCKEIVNNYFLENLSDIGKILVYYSFSPLLYNHSNANEIENFFIENPSFKIFQFQPADTYESDDNNHILLYKRINKN